MRALITFELKKLFKNKSLYVCLVASLLLLFLNALLTKSIADSSGTTTDSVAYILNFTSNGMLTMMIGIFTAIFVTEDFVSGTLKNIYAKGYSRSEVYLSKFIASTFSAILFLIVSLCGSILIVKNLFNGNNLFSERIMLLIVLQFILMLAYNSLFFIISISFGKLGSSIAFNIVGPSVIGLLLSLLDSFLKLDKLTLSNYWLDTCLSAVQSSTCSQSSLTTSAIVSMIVIIGSIFIGLKIQSRKEF